jgi:hypothetical protein
MKTINSNKLAKKSITSYLGRAKLSIRKAFAGSKVNCKLTFAIGKLGINKSGSIKVLFRAISDIGLPQFENPGRSNFTSVMSTNPNLQIKVNASGANFFGKLHTRPWTKGFMLVCDNIESTPGETITLTFQNWQMQTFCEKLFEIKILVDPFAVGKFWEIVKSPIINIIPRKPEKLVILSPSTVVAGKSFKNLVKFEDKWGNPCTNFSGVFKLTLKVGKRVFCRKARFKKGKILLTTLLTHPGVANIQIKCNHLRAISNPILAKQSTLVGHFWADLHGQSEETVGIKSHTLNDFFSFAKNYGFLDCVSHQGNDFQISDKFWHKINRLTRTKTEEGKFIVLPGFEWSGNTCNGGDRNVIFLNNNEPIFRSSRALLSNSKNITNTPSVLNLFKNLSGKNAFIIAHAGGRPANLSKHDNVLEKLVEVYSTWGNSEWLLTEALSKGFKVGAVANSDGHTGRPGAEFPTFNLFRNQGGLTCVLSETLTRKNIFNALRSRHCYATTGTRIFLDVKLRDNKTSRSWLMGDECYLRPNPSLELIINVIGTNKLRTIIINDGNKTVETQSCSNKIQLIIKRRLDMFEHGNHQIFVKIVQQDGHMAWSSPIFLNIRKPHKINNQFLKN